MITSTEMDQNFCDLPWYILYLFVEAEELKAEHEIMLELEKEYCEEKGESFERWEWEEPFYWEGVRAGVLEVGDNDFGMWQFMQIYRKEE